MDTATDTIILDRDDAPTRTVRRRRRRRRKTLSILLAIVLAATAGLYLSADVRGRDRALTQAGAQATPQQRTMLLATTLVDDLSQQADSLTLFAVGAQSARPVVTFVPVATLGQIPGQSSIEQIGKAMTLGRLPLQELTVENLMGIVIDGIAQVDDVSIGRVIDALGGIDVSVTERLMERGEDGRVEPVFALGDRRMSGADAVVYMTYRGEGVSELDRFVRAQKVWEGIFSAARARPGALERAVQSLGTAVAGDGAGALAEMMATVARAPADDRTYEVVPVVAAGSAQDELFQVDRARLDQLVERVFAGSKPPAGPVNGARVELRNGNGRPEVGELVAAALVPAGARIVVTGNARSFAFRKTTIVVYGDEAHARELGSAVRSLLGVGEVLIGRRGQSVVDVTVVVGKDFSNRKG